MLANVNIIAMLVAVVASMAIGAFWYTLLAKPWIAANGFSEEQIKSVNENSNPFIYVVAAVSHFVMAYILSGIIYHAGGYSLSNGILSALLIWVGFVVTTMAVNHRFQFKPWSLTIIDAGHYLFVLLAQGAILGWFGA